MLFTVIHALYYYGGLGGNGNSCCDICDQILENLSFGHIGRSDTIIHISEEKEAFGMKFHTKKV